MLTAHLDRAGAASGIERAIFQDACKGILIRPIAKGQLDREGLK